MTTTESLADIDLTNPDAFVAGVPHEWFTHLRREAPVYWHPKPDGPRFWAVTSYDDFLVVNRGWETYSSMRGAVFICDMPEDALEQQLLLMLNMAPPLHTRYR